MIYDCGSLRKNPMQSSTYRYIVTHRQTPSRKWPEDIAYEAAVFSQSDVSIKWLSRSLGLHYFRVQGLLKLFPTCRQDAPMNMASATYDDAYNYMKRGGPKTVPPSWVIPYMLEDKKNGMAFKEMCEHWCYPNQLGNDFLKGMQDVFHSQ